MKNSTFTKGPWKSGWVGERPHGAAVVWIPDSSTCNERVEVHTSNARANARLIAAAPELLAQCKFLEKVLASGDLSATEEGLRNCDTLAEVREILAKVEGEK